MENKNKYAVIIKHPYRDLDYRVDLVEVDESVTPEMIADLIRAEMLGPFEVIAVTQKVSNREMNFPTKQLEPPQHGKD